MKRVPEPRSLSLWRHFYDRERTADQLTNSTIEWQEKWEWDFLKINPAACYHVLDWGAEYQFFEDPLREPELVNPAIESAEDISRIKKPKPTAGALGDQLQVIRNLRKRFPELLIYETIFSPIEIAHRLMPSREALSAVIEGSPASAHDLLQQITDVFQEFAAHCVKAGADGIFFATKWASSDLLSWQQYEQFGKKYEMQVIDQIRRAGGSVILHVCGGNTYLQHMYDYPVDVFSYDFFASGCPLPQVVMERTGKLILGGIDPERAKTDVESVVEDCRIYMNLPRWVGGPSCVLPVEMTDADIQRLTHEVRAVLSC